MKIGDIRVTDAHETDGAIFATIRVVTALDKTGTNESAGTEHNTSATYDELAALGIDPTDAPAVIHYLARDLIAPEPPAKRGDLIAVSVDMAAIEAANAERIEAARDAAPVTE